MLFIVKWQFSAANRNAVVERFLKTGGTPPPGVKMIGRWHAVGQNSGFNIVESDDILKVQQDNLRWNDLINLEVFPAITDEQIAPLLAQMGK